MIEYNKIETVYERDVNGSKRHCTRQFAIERGIIAVNDTTTSCKLWWDEWIYIH